MTANPNRAVAALTPLVFAPAAGAISVLIAKHAPGVSIDSGSLEAIFIAGATIAFAKAGIWMKGWQDYEKRDQLASLDAEASPLDEPVSDPIDDLDEGFASDAEPDPDAELGLDFDEELDFDDSALDEDELHDFDEERNGMSLSSTQGM